MKNHRRTNETPQKNPGQISMQLAYILGKYPTFPEKSVSSPAKFLITFFSHQLWFSNFPPFLDQKLRKQQLIPYFFSKKHLVSAKNTRKHVFLGKFFKTPVNPWSFEKPRKNSWNGYTIAYMNDLPDLKLKFDYMILIYLNCRAYY